MPDCTVVSQQHLADMPEGEQIHVVKIAPYHDGLLIACRESEASTKIAVLSHDGKFLAEPQSLPQPLPVHDDMIVLPEAMSALSTATNGESTIRVLRVATMQRE